MQFYSASLDGTIALRDLGQQQHVAPGAGAAAPIRTWMVGEPVEGLVVTPDGGAFLSTHWGDRGAGRVTAFDLAEGKMGAERGRTTSPRQLVVRVNLNDA